MSLVLIVDPKSPILDHGAWGPSALHTIVQVSDAACEPLHRCSDLFDAMLLEETVLGSSPADFVSCVCTNGAPPVGVIAPTLDEETRIAILAAGAAFCLTGVVGRRELVLRVGNLLSRHAARISAAKSLILIGDWVLDLGGRRLLRPGGFAPTLTASEFDVFSLLAQSHSRVLTRDFIIEHLGRLGKRIDKRSIDIYVSRIRRRLRSFAAHVPFEIRSVRLEGYVFVADCKPRRYRSGKSLISSPQ